MNQEKYINVRDKARELGCNIPTNITILPMEFTTAECKDELTYPSIATSIEQAWAEAGIRETPLEEPGENRIVLLTESAFPPLLIPGLFFAYEAITKDPVSVQVAINVISDLVSEYIGIGATRNVRLEIAVETKQDHTQCVKLSYEGPVTGLKRIPDVLRRTVRH